jgi:predicted nucleic acid-binding protein
MDPGDLSALPSGERIFIDSNIFRIFSILSISELEVEECYKAIKDYALLTNDAFHVATMKRHEILNIATNDPDFERVKWIKVWKP